MSKAAPYQDDDKLGAELPREAPPGQVNDPSYKTSKSEAVPVVDDDEPVEGGKSLGGSADSDQQLGMFWPHGLLYALICLLFSIFCMGQGWGKGGD